MTNKKLLLAASVAACFANPIGASAAPGQVYVNLFEWKYTDIEQECVRALKPAGFSAIQISVPSEAKGNTNNWWERYQPVSYKLDGRLGTRQQLANMVATCRNNGIAIYADVVLGHMANGTGTGEAGSYYNSANNYPGPGYYSSDFHPRCTVDDSSAQNVQECWLSGDLPDLRTETPKVRQTAANHLKDLMSLGVAGFRVDTAKHMHANDLKAILDLAGPVNSATGAAFGLTRPWVTGEIFGGFGPVGEDQRSIYFTLGTMNEFKYPQIMRDTFTRRNGSISQLASLLPINDNSPNPRGLFASRNATVFVSNHDLERHNDSLTSRNSGKLFNLANIFMLAYPYGQTQLQSGFKLTGDQNNDTTLVPSGNIYTNGVPNFTHWDQQHRWREISNMVEFRNQTQGKWQIDDWTTNGNDRIAFHRGDRGFLAINRDDFNAWSHTFRTGMAPGRYCNVINGLLNADRTACSGDTVTVNSDGTAALTIPAMNAAGIPAVAIHAGQKLGGTSDVTAPSVPTGLATVAVSSNSVSLRWNPSSDNAGGSGMKGYNVVRDNGTAVFTTGTTLVDNSVLPNTVYKYTVAALDNANNISAASTPVLEVLTPGGSCTVQVNFQVSDNTTVVGQDVYLTGNRTELGNWNTSTAPMLSAAAWPRWTISRSLSAGTTYEYKYIKKGVRPLQWETGANRVIAVPGCGSAPVTIPLSNFRQ
ncbi:alpha amylase C-terminal domain-containing protein [Massilia sp. PAMC28688]|uniref:carbohydrate-binding module family 20 domain-containing protein n=1 Tax=Massilia sp. PAMC28688 TaxID=2861283 RepID=UPI001C6257BE|nr:carbohydrate-binding module family 20 domain-containing protein [Massilia sp. PAMC28688]QYF95402.1 alpha amylase C-terminal domain-containing protein [Massilia sp. PAMC28688]